MILRLLDAGDAAAAGALVAEGDVPPPYVDRLREVLDGVFSGDDEHLALGGLADDAGASRLAGVVLHGMVAGAIGTGALRGVLVARQWRRRGVGRALVHELERRFSDLGARRVRVLVLAHDAGALAFWAAMGYPGVPAVRYCAKTLDRGSGGPC